MLAILLPQSARADTTSDGFSYTSDGSSITITGYTGAGGALTIPSTITGLPVTTIVEFAFDSCGCLTSVAIPDSVTAIGNFAFDNSRNLISATIGSGVTSMGRAPFADCTNLSSITVDSQNPAFCSLNGVLFDKAQTTLIDYPGGRPADYAIPEGVATVGDAAFVNTQVTTVAIPDSVITFVDLQAGSAPFLSCGNLTSITVDSQNPAFSSVNGILFSKDQTSLLQYPSGIAGNYSIQDTVVSVGYFAFDSCPGLTSVIIGKGVTRLGFRSFQNCANLTSVYFRGNAPSISLPFGYRDITPTSDVFTSDTGLSVVVYLPGTTGWSVKFDNIPTTLFAPATFSAWQNICFTTTQLTDSNVSGATAAPTNDGVPNLVKYAFGINPFATMGVNNNPSLPDPAISNGNLTLTFNAAQNDIVYTVESSTDLVNWSTLGVTSQVNGAQIIASHALSASGGVFLHIAITLNP